MATQLSANATRESELVVGVVSDTHFPRFGTQLPKRLIDGLRKANVRAILHAGDLVTPLAIELLETIAPVVAVQGNNDKRKHWPKPLPPSTVVEFAGVRVGLVHGHAGTGRTTPDRAFNTFLDENVAAIVFGHSHVPHISMRDGRLLVNPGSPTDKRLNLRYSFATLTVEANRVTAKMHYYSDRSP